jgi:hypothetical protein
MEILYPSVEENKDYYDSWESLKIDIDIYSSVFDP